MGTVPETLSLIAANIDEDFYQKSRLQLHNIIKYILHNFVPDTNSTSRVFEEIRYIKGRNKSQFIQFFYFFHNKVNDRRK